MVDPLGEPQGRLSSATTSQPSATTPYRHHPSAVNSAASFSPSPARHSLLLSLRLDPAPPQLGATRTGRAGRLPPRRSPRAARRIDTARAHAGECGQRERSRMQKILHTRARACERACGEGSFTSGGRTGPGNSFPFIFFPIHIFGVTSSQGPDGPVIRLRKQEIPMKQTRDCRRRSSSLFADTADDWR